MELAYRRQVEVAGGRQHRVDGLIDAAGEEAASEAGRADRSVVSTFREPYRLEGRGGTGLVGLWKAFEELEALGWLHGRKPRLMGVQAKGCAPVVVRALGRGEARVEPWSEPATAAHGLRVARPYADARAARESGNVGV